MSRIKSKGKQCGGVTKSGGQCKRLVTGGGRFCLTHKKPTSAAPTRIPRVKKPQRPKVSAPKAAAAAAAGPRMYCRAADHGPNRVENHCGNIATHGGFCKKHQSEKNRPEGSWKSLFYYDPEPEPIEFQTYDRDSDSPMPYDTYCRAIVKSGPNVHGHCAKTATTPNGYCTKHMKLTSRPDGEWNSGEYIII